MIRIVFLAPFEELKELAEQVFAEVSGNDRTGQSSGRHYEFCAMLAPTTAQALSLDLNADELGRLGVVRRRTLGNRAASLG